MFARDQLRQPFLFLFVRSEQKQSANADGMMGVHKDRCRRAARADLFQNLAVRHLRKTVTAVFHRRGHSQNADAAQTVNHFARNLRLSIYLYGVELGIEKLAQFGKRFVELSLLRCRHARIRHHPIRYEMAEKKAFCESESLRSGEKQFFRLLNFFSPLRLDFVHRCTERSRALPSTTSLTRSAFRADAACARPNHFVTAAMRTDDVHEHGSECFLHAIGVAAAIWCHLR